MTRSPGPRAPALRRSVACLGTGSRRCGDCHGLSDSCPSVGTCRTQSPFGRTSRSASTASSPTRWSGRSRGSPRAPTSLVAADARYADYPHQRRRRACPLDHPAQGLRQRRRRDQLGRRPPKHQHLTEPDAPVVAVNDGVIKKIGDNPKLSLLHRPPGRLRQHLHVLAARLDREDHPVPRSQNLSAWPPSSRRPTRTRRRTHRRP